MPLHQSFTRPLHRKIIILRIIGVNSIVHCFCLYQAKIYALTFFIDFSSDCQHERVSSAISLVKFKNHTFPFGICMFVATGLWSFLFRTLISRNSTFRHLYKRSLTRVQYTCLTHWLNKQSLL